LAQLRPDVPRSLVAIIEKMMARQRADRYQTPGEVALALQAWLVESPSTTKTPEKTPVAVPVTVPAPTNPTPATQSSGDEGHIGWLTLLALAALGALVGLAAVMFWKQV
jgi:hypothetical protein